MTQQDDITQRLRDNADLDEAEHGNARVVQMEREAADEIERLRTELSKLRAPVAVPPGWKLVPVEPTPEMEDAGCDVPCPQDDAPAPATVYAAMIGAAPPAPEVSAPVAGNQATELRQVIQWGADNIKLNGPEAKQFADFLVALDRAALASAPVACDHQFHFFGDQKERRCNRCGVVESKASAPVAGEARTYRPTEAAILEACDLLDTIKKSHGYWGGWSSLPSVCDEAIGLLRYSGTHAAPQASEAVPLLARALAEWHEDDGPVTWWAWCGHEWAGEAPWFGTPLDQDWPGYHTHWTPIPGVPAALSTPQASEARCSCPSGDGSLRHPCAVHPAGEGVPVAWAIFSPSGNIRYWHHDKANVEEFAAKHGLTVCGVANAGPQSRDAEQIADLVLGHAEGLRVSSLLESGTGFGKDVEHRFQVSNGQDRYGVVIILTALSAQPGAQKEQSDA